MFGRGDLEEAKALRDSFARARQGRGRATNNYTNTSQRGRGHGARQPPAAQHGHQQQRGGFHQQRGGFHQQGSAHHQYGSFSTNPGSFAPPQQPLQPSPQPQPRRNELLNFNRPLAYQSGQRQENMPPQQQQQSTVPGSTHSPALTPAPAPTSAFPFSTPTPTTFTTANSGRTANLPQIDEEGEKSQRASQNANEKRTQQARKADVDADGTDEITPARYGGLSASRWNTDDVSHSESSFMDIDEEEQQEQQEQPDDTRDGSQQGGLAPPGRIVTSGMLQGPGLRSSRWNSSGQYR
ncbi:hypothetical protein ABKA04_000312 [Annulohypoxylon sp. FPYF3050]